VCVVGGFIGGFAAGALDGTVGSELGHTTVEGRPSKSGFLETTTAPLSEGAGALYNILDINIRELYDGPF
jgi:hypothetical protein